jgi:hypothetical protein
MDADLQDSPEDVPRLLAALASGGSDVVCAGRRGDYTGPGRRRTAAAYRRLARLLSGGRIPVDAGMFSAWHRTAVDRIVALDDHAVPLVPAAARARLRIATLPLDRQARPQGRSATGSLRRLRVAAQGLVTLTPLHAVARRLQAVRRRPPAAQVVELGHFRGGPARPSRPAETERRSLPVHRESDDDLRLSVGTKDAMPEPRRPRPSEARAMEQ